MKDHLALLRTEHTELQSRYSELKKKYEIATATCPNEGVSFASSVLSLVNSLFGETKYSDIRFSVAERTFHAHRLVVAARTTHWNLVDNELITIDDVEPATFEIALRWIYQDTLAQNYDASTLMAVANLAIACKLPHLVELCERSLSLLLEVKNAVSIYEFADRVNSKDLKEKCSQLITERWKEFSPEHFANFPAPLLLRLLKSQCENPLHTIIDLEREDALFLYFVENDSKLFDLVNAPDSEGILSLERALRRGNYSIAKQLLQHKADPNKLNSKQCPLMIKFVQEDLFDAVQFLVENGANLFLSDQDGSTVCHHLAERKLSAETLKWIEVMIEQLPIDLTNKKKQSPLHVGVLSGNIDFISRLLSTKRVDLNKVDVEGSTPLSLALFTNKNEDIAQKLLIAGADINKQFDNGDYLVHRAIGDIETLNFLLEKGANPEVFDKEGESPLAVAVHWNCGKSIETLIRYGAVTKGYLHLAINSNYLEAATVLLSNGADVNEVDSSKETPLLVAIRSKNDDATVFLLNNGASHLIKNTPSGCTITELCVAGGLAKAVRLLTSLGIDLNERVDQGAGFPLIIRAFENEHWQCASVLISAGCDLEGRTVVEGAETTLLHESLKRGWSGAATLLIEAGCDLNATRRLTNSAEADRRTPLHMAVVYGNYDVIPFIISFGADLERQDNEGRTAGHLAVQEGSEKAIEALLASENVGFLSVRDRLGHTPLSLAITLRHHRIASTIVKRQPHAALQCNGSGENLLHTAVKANDLESVLFLLGTEMDASQPTADTSRRTAIHLAVEYANNEMILRNLLLTGCNVNGRCSEGSIALHTAARCGRAAHAMILLENNADPSIQDNKGNTAIHIALSNGASEVAKALLSNNNADLRITNKKGLTPLHMCASTCGALAVETCEMLLNTLANGAPEVSQQDIDVLDANGNTPLLLAYMAGNAAVCRLLLKRGASMGIRNYDGISMFNYDTPTKQLLFGLLDTLEREPRWAEGDTCSDCGVKFSITTRKHHCRHCGRVMCSKCSETAMPILKFGEEKRQRVCALCAQVLTIGAPRS
ncbi:unnamed protein product, partial [Mesorhabditis belari]|uniref:Ankyrin repeat and FYVE domain-containing protein 1 n=1 Tax=Mesorhabditis belari TaxID=2138241 RepID=A0AAF3F6B5_9BILA